MTGPTAVRPRDVDAKAGAPRHITEAEKQAVRRVIAGTAVRAHGGNLGPALADTVEVLGALGLLPHQSIDGEEAES